MELDSDVKPESELYLWYPMQWVRAVQPQDQGRGELLKGKYWNQGISCPVVLGLDKEGIG